MSRRLFLIEYFFTDARLLAFVVRADLEQPEVVTIKASPPQIRSDVLEAATDPRTGLAEVLARPSLVACIQPILDYADPDDVVCIVPSAELFYAPLHAVPACGIPLISRNAIFYAPSASALRHCVRRRPPAEADVARATVFGNPTWDLDHAQEEAVIVAKLLGTEPVIGADVTRERWFEAMATSDIIHFAGHAEFDRKDPLASCLFLANDDPLTARELFAAAGSPIRLITLSGCETGVNRIHPGDELLGLTRSLLYAGASSLMLTLWPVDDESSAQLMTAFYDRWLKQGQTKVDALRGAQEDLWTSGVTDPYHYSRFILIGDWL